MRLTTTAEVVATGRGEFVRHHLEGSPSLRAWVHGRAVAAEQPDRHGDPQATLWVVGPTRDVGPLLAGVAEARHRPDRVLVDAHAVGALPGSWEPASGYRTWHWMWTREVPSSDPCSQVVEVVDPDEVAAFLAAAYPDSFARPGDPDVDCWLGVRDAVGRDGVAVGPVVALGALVRRPDGTGYVRAVSVRPSHRGRGLARAVSAALTRRALGTGTGTGVATLGVFVDNAPALAVYRRLGYVVEHTFASCVLA